MVLFLALSFSACRTKDFDAPPGTGQDPVGVNANISIKALKDWYYNKNLTNVTIDSDLVISGVVNADDKSGNYYKTMVIEDATGGIAIRIDVSNFYTNYGIGRRVFVKLKGMAIGSYSNLIQLGSYIDSSSVPYSVGPIPSPLVGKYLFPGQWGITLTPTVLDIGQLADTRKWQNRLVEIPNVQFLETDTSQIWADQIGLISINRTVEDCYNKNMIIRTSGYAHFASQLTPSGSGNLVGIMSVYGTTGQFIIRDVTDAQFTGGRFVVGTCPLPPTTLANIIDIRSQYSGAATVVAGNLKIRGVVISDAANGNINSSNCVIQDGTGGIVVRFSAPHPFLLGDSLEINITSQTLSEYKGWLEIGGTTPSVPLAYATKLGTGTITPHLVTIADLNANMSGTTDTWESTLVQIQNATITGTGATYSGNTTVTDATGNLLMYTATAASFSTTPFLTGPRTITAIVSDYTTGVQLLMRNAADVQ